MGAKLNSDSLAGGVNPLIPPVLGQNWLKGCKSFLPSTTPQVETVNNLCGMTPETIPGLHFISSECH